ncbi:MAG: hypothetical protein JW746_01390 [Candidatus Krumholzibacteriota bacterium]|nr:hypothetical protein [Candidatus Krumholzibacteriota bacterium]
MFDTDGVSYPVRFANYQRNSFVPVETRSAGRLVWSRNYFEIDETLLLIPVSVQISNGFLGVRSTNDLLIFTCGGEFKYGIEIGENQPVVLGKQAIAYTKPSYQLEYRDYDGELILESKGFPALKDYCRLHLLKPSQNDFLAAVEFSGGPDRLPGEYDIFKLGLEESLPPWSFCGEGALDHVLLHKDGRTLIVIQGADVTLLNTEDGKENGSFRIEMDKIISASLDLENNLVLVGEESVGGSYAPFLKVMTLTGELKWSYKLLQPQSKQPPVCGNGSRVYAVGAMKVICLVEGEEIWSFRLRSEQPAWLTATADNKLICLNGGFLSAYDDRGELIFDTALASDGETFDAPAALDLNGRLYVAGGERLYCVE